MHKLQKKILEQSKTIDIAQYGYRKLGEFIGETHPQKVKWHLNKLINDGYLRRTSDGKLEATDPNDMTGRLAKVPILGMANCGEALSFADNTQFGFLNLSVSLIKSSKLASLFAVQATGDSMNNCSVSGQAIEDGDYVIVDASTTVPNNGEYVVSSIEGLANIKKYIRDEANQVIALVSESTKPRPPIMVDPNDEASYRVHGKVVQVIKTSNYS